MYILILTKGVSMKKLSLLMALSLVVASNVFAGPSVLERMRNSFRSEADQRAFYDATGKGYTCMQLLTTHFDELTTFSTLADMVVFLDAFEKCVKRHPEHTNAAMLLNYHLLLSASFIKGAHADGRITEEQMNEKIQK